jgi:hypothetical protein
VTLLLTDKVLPFQEIKIPTPGVQSVFWQQTLQYVVDMNGDSGEKAVCVINLEGRWKDVVVFVSLLLHLQRKGQQ